VIQSGHTGDTNAIVNRMSGNGVRAVQSLGEAQHHNKYAAIDARHSDPSKAWVVTSSWNATDSGTFQQFQNMVNIQDVALARAYELEFNQTWGGDSGDFNPGAARFSEDKEIVNPSAFWIGEEDTYVELHFSPQTNTEAQINRALSTAQESIDLGLNLITRRAISNTMLSRFNEGVDVRGAIGVTNIQGSDFEYLQSWADVHEFSQSQFGLLHHKYAIIDGEQAGENAKVITGSHNWSGNANFENDENTLIIHSPRVANEFFQEYAARYWQAGGQATFNVPVSIADADTELPARARLAQNYPNPFNPSTTISFELPASDEVSLRVYDITGREVATLVSGQQMSAGQHNVSFDASNLASGMYIYRMQLGSGNSMTRKMMLVK
jgi:phosphatidylserine/phosphatidylglycerophosphate/cardiolipin synthase-like enzyme